MTDSKRLQVVAHLTPDEIALVEAAARIEDLSRNKFLARAVLDAARAVIAGESMAPQAVVPCQTADGAAWLWIYPDSTLVRAILPPGWNAG